MKNPTGRRQLEAACVFTSTAEDLNLVGLSKSNSSDHSGRELNLGLLDCESNVLTTYLHCSQREIFSA